MILIASIGRPMTALYLQDNGQLEIGNWKLEIVSGCKSQAPAYIRIRFPLISVSAFQIASLLRAFE